MRRTHKTAHAPLGAGFFLFLGLAMLPLSMRAAGIQISFNPSLYAANDALSQIAGMLGASYQSEVPSESCRLIDSDPEPANEPNLEQREVACAYDSIVQLEANRDSSAPKAVRSKRVQCVESSSPKRIAPVVALLKTERLSRRLDNQEVVFQALKAIKPETLFPNGVLVGIPSHALKVKSETKVDVRGWPIPEDLRVFLRMRPTSVAPKPTETKVKALASVRQAICPRAQQFAAPATSPDTDNSEL